MALHNRKLAAHFPAVGAVYEAVNKLILENAEKKQALEWPINDVGRRTKAFSAPQMGDMYRKSIHSQLL
jgi:hypothetical protein